MMTYTVRTEAFEGPLHVLLELIEERSLEIENISLALVTEPYVAYVREHQAEIAPTELADFLAIAARLVYLKARTLLPDAPLDPLLEEEGDLVEQLRAYQVVVAASETLRAWTKQGMELWSGAPRQRLRPLAPLQPLDAEQIATVMERLLRRLDPLRRLPKAAIERLPTLEEALERWTLVLKRAPKHSFHALAQEAQHRAEVVLSFIALLELVRQRKTRVEQSLPFDDIYVYEHA